VRYLRNANAVTVAIARAKPSVPVTAVPHSLVLTGQNLPPRASCVSPHSVPWAPGRYRPDLAASLSNLGSRLADPRSVPGAPRAGRGRTPCVRRVLSPRDAVRTTQFVS
jgi:hypothetical protein